MPMAAASSFAAAAQLPQMAEPRAEATETECTLTFSCTPLGMTFMDGGVVKKVAEGGQAASNGVELDWSIVRVGQRDVAGGSLKNIVAVITEAKTHGIDFTVTFSKVPLPEEELPEEDTFQKLGNSMFSWGRSLTAKSLEVGSAVAAKSLEVGTAARKSTSEFAEKQGLGELDAKLGELGSKVGSATQQGVGALGAKVSDLGTKVGTAAQQGLKDVDERVNKAVVQVREEGLGKAVGSVAQDTVNLTTKVGLQVVEVSVDLSKKTAEHAEVLVKKTAEHADGLVQGFRDSAKAEAAENAEVEAMIAMDVLESEKRSYLVDNSELDSPNAGLGYRIAPRLFMVDPEEKVAPWDSVVLGVPCGGDEWLKLGAKAYLPMKLAGKVVLKASGAAFVPPQRSASSASADVLPVPVPVPATAAAAPGALVSPSMATAAVPAAVAPSPQPVITPASAPAPVMPPLAAVAASAPAAPTPATAPTPAAVPMLAPAAVPAPAVVPAVPASVQPPASLAPVPAAAAAPASTGSEPLPAAKAAAPAPVRRALV